MGLLALLGLLSSASSVLGATDGTLGPTSAGDDNLSLEVPALAKISDIADMNFGNYSGTGALTLDDDVCVYVNASSGQYKVTAQGSGVASAFTLTDGSQTIAYTVRWNNTSGTSGNAALTATVQSGTLTGANTASLTCGGGSNANFQVTMTQSALLNVKSSTYTGVLTLIIDPN